MTRKNSTGSERILEVFIMSLGENSFLKRLLHPCKYKAQHVPVHLTQNIRKEICVMKRATFWTQKTQKRGLKEEGKIR